MNGKTDFKAAAALQRRSIDLRKQINSLVEQLDRQRDEVLDATGDPVLAEIGDAADLERYVRLRQYAEDHGVTFLQAIDEIGMYPPESDPRTGVGEPGVMVQNRQQGCYLMVGKISPSASS